MKYLNQRWWLIIILSVGVLVGGFLDKTYPALFPFAGTYYWLIAFVWSILIAYYAFEIHQIKRNIREITEFNAEKQIRYTQSEDDDYCYQIKNSVKLHQFIFNFAGAIVGWIVIYNWNTIVSQNDDGLVRILLGSIVFISLTGYLPYIITKFGPFAK